MRATRAQREQTRLLATEAALLRRTAEKEQFARRSAYPADMNLAQQALANDNLGLAKRILQRQRPAAGETDLRGWEWRYLSQQARSGAAAILARYGHFEDIPEKASAWEVPGVGRTRAVGLAATLREHWDEALLYRDLARLRTDADGVQIRQRDPDELRWDGAPRDAWEGFCEEWGLDRLRTRPHRWLDEG